MDVNIFATQFGSGEVRPGAFSQHAVALVENRHPCKAAFQAGYLEASIFGKVIVGPCQAGALFCVPLENPDQVKGRFFFQMEEESACRICFPAAGKGDGQFRLCAAGMVMV